MTTDHQPDIFFFPSLLFLLTPNPNGNVGIRSLWIKGLSNFRVYTLSQQNNLQYNIPSAEAEGDLLKAWNLLWIEQWVNRSTFTWILRTFCKDNLKHLLSFSIGFWAFNLNANSVLNVMWCELISPSSISNLWQTSLTHTWPAPVNRHRTIQFNFNPELKTIETDNLNNWVESEWRLEFDCVLCREDEDSSGYTRDGSGHYCRHSFSPFHSQHSKSHHTTKVIVKCFLLLYKNITGSSEKLVVPSYRKYVWQNKIIMLVGGR